LVGAIGIGVQMGAFALLSGALGLNYLLATALAVETAVLHNFAWHERYTWRDRPRSSRRDSLARLARFHVGNGFLSIAGNLALMRLFAGQLGMNRYLAGGLSVAICSILNFAAAEWFVFRS
jgi:putative flippase GtrA